MARQDVTNASLMKHAADHPRAGKRPYGGPWPQRQQGQIPDGLWVWMNDMVEWGKDVRKDILRIESRLNLAAADPGDPPPPPPDDNE